jgi:hypothetical protein
MLGDLGNQCLELWVVPVGSVPHSHQFPEEFLRILEILSFEQVYPPSLALEVLQFEGSPPTLTLLDFAALLLGLGSHLPSQIQHLLLNFEDRSVVLETLSIIVVSIEARDNVKVLHVFL